MTNTKDYTFEVSLSSRGFENKPDKKTEVPNLRFNRTTTDIEGFAMSIVDGYCYAGIYKSDSITMTEKTNDNYLYSYLVSIDIDHTHVSMDDMIDRIEFKPTLAYTSYNNGINGECRYRLVYCFYDKIEGKENYANYVNAIVKAIGLDVKDIDPKSLSACQYYNGNGSDNIEVYLNDIIYCKEDIIIPENKNIITEKKKSNDIKDNKSVNQNHIYNPPYNICLNDTFENTGFIYDYWHMRMEDVLSKYVDVYPNLEHTQIDLPDEDTPLIIFPEGYTEIRRWWRVNRDGKPIKIKDGEGRRRKLFLNGILRRLINPEITIENLLYNLLYELCYYISNYNAENVIGKKEIFQIANDVMKEDITKYECMRGSKKKFTVNPAYCAKHNLNKRQVINMVGKQERDQKIGELYDFLLTDKENLEVMRQNGLIISSSTLKRWREANGITKYRKSLKTEPINIH